MPARQSSDTPVNRRRFLGNSARNAAGVAAGMAAGVVGWPEEAVSAESGEPLHVGVIGVRAQGRVLANELARFPDVVVAALCDVDAGQLTSALQQAAQWRTEAPPPRGESDFRRLLDDPRVDAVVIAVPDHWHAVMAAWAMEAGKDVYLEAPVTHTLDEAVPLQQIARRTGRIVQGGLQQRSGTQFRQAVEYVQSGRLGAVHLARAWTVHQKKSIGFQSECSPPADVDYDLWLGPAPAAPFHPNRYHGNWRSFWDYGSGELGNWGVQMLDVARWGLGVELPLQVAAAGGNFYHRDDQQTPDTLSVHYSFPDCTIIWEHRLWSSHAPEGRSTAVSFHGDQGTLIVDRGGWKVYGGGEAAGAADGRLLTNHLRDFIDCIRTRTQPAANLSVAVPSSALCHLGALAYRVGRSIVVDPGTGLPRNDPAADRLARTAHRQPWGWPSDLALGERTSKSGSAAREIG